MQSRQERSKASDIIHNIVFFLFPNEMKRCLLLGRKVMTNLDSIFKSRNITLPTKVCSTPGLLVHYQLLESTQIHVHWVGDAISSSVVPFSSCPQSFPASGSFQMSQLFASGGQSIGVSASASSQVFSNTSTLSVTPPNLLPISSHSLFTLKPQGAFKRTHLTTSHPCLTPFSDPSVCRNQS